MFSPIYVDAEAAASYLDTPFNTVKSWIRRYDVPRVPDPKRPRGRLYDLHTLQDIKNRRNHEPPA